MNKNVGKTGFSQQQPYFLGLVLGLFFIFLLTNCFEPQDGCLDLNATNYDVSADDFCSNCCTYPSLSLAFRHLVVLPDDPDTTIFFRYNTYYPTPMNLSDTFTIERIRYFLSDIRLVKFNGEEVRVLDSIDVEINGVDERIEDSYGKIDRDIFKTINVGTIVTNGVFKSIRFNVGLDANERKIDPETVETASQLYVQTDTLLYDTLNMNYLSSLVIFNRDTLSMMDSTVVKILEETNLIEVPFSESYDLSPGSNIKITIDIDYLSWFKGIDIKNEPVNAALRSKFLENIVTSFSISKIE